MSSLNKKSVIKKKKLNINNQLLVDYFAPTNYKEMCGNKKEFIIISNYFRNFKTEFEGTKKKKVFLLTGKPGIGKSTLVNLAAKFHKLRVIEYNASNVRSASKLKETLYGEVISKFFQRPIFLIDEVDGMSKNKDRGGMAMMIEIIKRTKALITNKAPLTNEFLIKSFLLIHMIIIGIIKAIMVA